MNSSAIKSHGEEMVLIYRLMDILVMSATFFIISKLYLSEIPINYLVALSFGIVMYSVFSELFGVYNNSVYSSIKDTFVPVFFSWFCMLSVLLSLGFIGKVTESYSRIVLGSWFVMVPTLLVLFRLLVCRLSNYLRRHSYTQKSIIIGATSTGFALAKEIEDNSDLGLQLSGIYDDRSRDRLEVDSDFTLSGTINEALEQAKERNFRHVYVALPMAASPRIKEIIQYFSDSTARVYIVPDFFTFDLIQSRWRNVGSIPTLSIHDTPFYGLSSVFKRLEDVIVASLIILLISPVLVLVSIGVKLSSKGPIIFKQDRYGIDGKKIKVWKFRSMSSQDNGAVVKQATKNDPRMTKFGAFIRRTSLDELPQFFNVLQGNMSIVGPRPHAVAHNEEYRAIIEKYMLRHKVKPGITGWAQINGYRGETDTLDKMEKRVEYDLSYIRSWSLILDMKIIFLTIFKGFVSKTAY